MYCAFVNLTVAIFSSKAHGDMQCSGGCFRGDLRIGDDGYRKIFVPEGFTNLTSLPMFLTLAMVLTLFSVATYFDHKLFHTEDHNKIDFHWLTYYMLGIFGYLDLEGGRLTFKRQVYFNPCACSKCPRQLKLCDDCTQNMNSGWSFLSIFILSLGVSLLFGSGANHPQVCLFNA